MEWPPEHSIFIFPDNVRKKVTIWGHNIERSFSCRGKAGWRGSVPAPSVKLAQRANGAKQLRSPVIDEVDIYLDHYTYSQCGYTWSLAQICIRWKLFYYTIFFAPICTLFFLDRELHECSRWLHFFDMFRLVLVPDIIKGQTKDIWIAKTCFSCI